MRLLEQRILSAISRVGHNQMWVMSIACLGLLLLSTGCTTMPKPVRTEVTPATLDLSLGESQKIDVVTIMSNGKRVTSAGVDWRCDAPAVVEISEANTVTALGCGSARLTAYGDMDSLIGSVQVNVCGDSYELGRSVAERIREEGDSIETIFTVINELQKELQAAHEEEFDLGFSMVRLDLLEEPPSALATSILQASKAEAQIDQGQDLARRVREGQSRIEDVQRFLTSRGWCLWPRFEKWAFGVGFVDAAGEGGALLFLAAIHPLCL